MTIKTNFVVLLTMSIATIAGCTTPTPYGDAYAASETRTIQQVYYGTIVKAEPVTIAASDKTNIIAMIAGAAIGGILGSEVGGGAGSDIAAIGGSVAGGYAGSEIADAAGERNGVNLTIRLEDGRIISIVQEVNPSMIFQQGQAVQVNVDGNTARVVPR
ncbi:17 kDa surface antigen [Shewanella halifaxensis HAW-EB4]|uniref:17 kDa surface antigen n=1 Tax=Shewanella halifaxensis (strain HAW-EB4) TaxID=458817 RepID=B0TRY8_SHEHH|nr:glycine zipper 2TM domain-containing protein [Shewanella halifaxensis]ABZ77900.1 17 kDa surface antigen [Shewanella halifaxensis HAW-EB4]